ncbi:DUF4189 domain-containing protein [Luteibacter aegosomatis]|uniref:DUF4189 domain-containing protein n=1 Tax=Luteibacter aegosomatis TaxID=2911537 RepID=UPI001FF8FBB8|nr:DUF4189 domain-containing protein [Luteibacter aegosomatis]UPG86395.1 DUF4189 domain-containing protein [Luteibacter aegosomatis]
MSKQPIPLLFLLSIWSAQAIGEGGCPPGQYPQAGQGWQTCIPMPTAPPEVSLPPRQHEVWRSGYGSLAIDVKAGALGSADDQPSRMAAEAEAMNACRQAGGLDCVIRKSYEDECLAMAVGKKGFMLRTGLSQEKTEKEALKACEKKNDRCEIHHSSCSTPFRFR